MARGPPGNIKKNETINYAIEHGAHGLHTAISFVSYLRIVAVTLNEQSFDFGGEIAFIGREDMNLVMRNSNVSIFATRMPNVHEYLCTEEFGGGGGN